MKFIIEIGGLSKQKIHKITNNAKILRYRGSPYIGDREGFQIEMGEAACFDGVGRLTMC